MTAAIAVERAPPSPPSGNSFTHEVHSVLQLVGQTSGERWKTTRRNRVLSRNIGIFWHRWVF